jgi:hypothetical protein
LIDEYIGQMMNIRDRVTETGPGDGSHRVFEERAIAERQ